MGKLKVLVRKMINPDPRLLRKIRKLFAPFKRIGLKKEFTIFSNNCYGGRLYDKFGLQYLTPTIGLAISCDDYIKFLENFDYYFTLDLVPIEEKQKKVNNERGFYDCQLGDIVIGFRHYRDSQDAIKKWNRRKTRVKQDNIIVKMSYYSETIDDELVSRFAKLPYKKILFTNHESLMKYSNIGRIVILPIDCGDKEFVLADQILKDKEMKKIINR